MNIIKPLQRKHNFKNLIGKSLVVNVYDPQLKVAGFKFRH